MSAIFDFVGDGTDLVAERGFVEVDGRDGIRGFGIGGQERRYPARPGHGPWGVYGILECLWFSGFEVDATILTEVLERSRFRLYALDTGIAFPDRDQIGVLRETGEVLAVVHDLFFEFEREDCFEAGGDLLVGRVVL